MLYTHTHTQNINALYMKRAGHEKSLTPNKIPSFQVKNLKTPALVVFKDIVRQEGIGALYNGLIPTLIRTIPATATLFVTVEYTKKIMSNYF